jgi:anti-sigma regulatory factor (Ser/Thr protein kinase)
MVVQHGRTEHGEEGWMTGERQRRTPSGNTLRLVGGTGGELPRGTVKPVGADGVGDASLVLPGHRQSVAVGRHWVVRTAAERGVTGMASQVVELLSSELLANAVLHGGEGAIGIRLRHTAEVLRVSVSDAGDHSPVVLHTEPSALSGRGMAIVEAMSHRWGIEPHAEGGKTVWFEIDLAEF